jgi:hypothetical protein
MDTPRKRTETVKEQTEARIRVILEKHLRKFSEVLLTQKCIDNLDEMINGWDDFVDLLAIEAERKERSPAYLEFCRNMLTGAAQGQLGSLGLLPPERLATLDAMLGSVVASYSGESPDPIGPEALAAFQNSMLMPPKQRGAKQRSYLDQAYERRKAGEKLTDIAKDLEPEAFKQAPEEVLQRYSAGVRRREQKAVSAQARSADLPKNLPNSTE